MWLTLVALLTLCATGRTAENVSESSIEKEKLVIARGKMLVVPVKKMKADEISSLLDSLGFYKRSQKGEKVPEEFKHFPLKAPRDEL
ncbi:seleno M-like protein [Labeo rohita]|uniref:Seleno M-like protein n=1 Tax=Labeo rohita TaxID=84645 RepID=A0A498LJH1_LABRO|nr:seleno M-like protein [Labeo rohita]RXN28575.1 seleno M-like protein [Labeo rohita]